MAETIVIWRHTVEVIAGSATRPGPPRYLAAFLQPFGMLIEHRVDHVHKSLVEAKKHASR